MSPHALYFTGLAILSLLMAVAGFVFAHFERKR